LLSCAFEVYFHANRREIQENKSKIIIIIINRKNIDKILIFTFNIN